MIDPKQTRGYLNNNPGNMDRGDPPWNGEIRDIAEECGRTSARRPDLGRPVGKGRDRSRPRGTRKACARTRGCPRAIRKTAPMVGRSCHEALARVLQLGGQELRRRVGQHLAVLEVLIDEHRGEPLRQGLDCLQVVRGDGRGGSVHVTINAKLNRIEGNINVGDLIVVSQPPAAGDLPRPRPSSIIDSETATAMLEMTGADQPLATMK